MLRHADPAIPRAMILQGNDILWAIAGLAAVVFITRNVFVVLPAALQPRGALERALRHVPIAALAALTLPQSLVVLRSASPDLMLVLTDARLPAAVVTVLVAWWWRSALWGMLAGCAVFGLLLVHGAALAELWGSHGQ